MLTLAFFISRLLGTGERDCGGLDCVDVSGGVVVGGVSGDVSGGC